MAEPEKKFPSDEVTEDALRRLKEARAQKADARLDLQESLFFTRPRLSYEVLSTTSTVKNPRNSNQEDDLATGIGPEVSEDFATEVIAAFFPHGAEWAESGFDASEMVGVEAFEIEELKKRAKIRDKQIFSAINASNFGAVLGTSLDPHASIGTIAYWIDKPFNTKPTDVQHVPPRQLEFNVGPDGKVNDRFRVRWTKASRRKELIGDIALPSKLEHDLKQKKDQNIEIAWGYWRDPESGENEIWEHVLLVNKIAVKHEKMEGSEACLPLLVARFSPDSDCAWGYGPAMKSLQEFRVLDAITAGTQDTVDIAVSPPIYYPDDGVLDFENGLEAGKAYPKRPGGGSNEIGSLYFPGNADLGFYTAADLEKRIRRKFFADYPEQAGKTPPTATQWVDQMLMAQRRIGTPGALFWLEGPYAVFRRFEWILEKDGKIEPITINGRKLALTPRNPATQAQDQQKLQLAFQLLNAFKGFFPETAQAAIDEAATIKKIQDLSKDEIIVLRDQTQITELVKQVLGAAQQMGAPPQ